MISVSEPAGLVYVGFVYVLAGFIKGIIGIGLPTTALALLTVFVTPLEAMAINILPMMATNIYQFWRADDHRQLVRDYGRFALFLCVFLFMASFMAAGLGNNVIRLLIAVSVLVFVANNLSRVRWRIQPRQDDIWQYSMGALSGILGGLTSIWGVPMTIYLVMKQLSPKQFVDATGFLILIGCLPLSVGYFATGILTLQAVLPASAGVAAAFAGFYFGARVRRFVRPERFHKFVLLMFLFMGLKMGFDALRGSGLV